jgi:cell division protein ZapA
MDKSIITVNIFGNEYTIKGVAEPDYIMTLANYLNNKMAEVQEATGLKDVKKIAILAAINISDELFETKKSIKESYIPNEQLQAIRGKIESLISLIDKELPSSPDTSEGTGASEAQGNPPEEPKPGTDRGQDQI